MPKKLKIKTKKHSGNSRINPYILALVTAAGTALILCMAFAQLIMMGILSQAYIPILALIVAAGSTFAGCIVLGKRKEEKKLINGYILVAVILGILVLCNILFIKEPLKNILAFVVVLVLSSTLAALLLARPKKRRRV